MTIICLIGPMRTGKTIIAEQLVASHGFTHVHESWPYDGKKPPAGDVVIVIDGPEWRSKNYKAARAAGVQVVHFFRGEDRPMEDEVKEYDLVFQMPELVDCRTGSPGLSQAADALLRKLR